MVHQCYSTSVTEANSIGGQSSSLISLNVAFLFETFCDLFSFFFSFISSLMFYHFIFNTYCLMQGCKTIIFFAYKNGNMMIMMHMVFPA